MITATTLALPLLAIAVILDYAQMSPGLRSDVRVIQVAGRAGLNVSVKLES